MKKLRIYLDTSVIGGCFDDEFQEASLKLIEEIKSGINIGVVSSITLSELEKAPANIRRFFSQIEHLVEKLVLDNEATLLAENYIKEKILDKKSTDDCLHIAIAAVNKVDVLVSWNFKHIVNFNKIIQFNSVNLKNGYGTLQIYSPKEVINNE